MKKKNSRVYYHYQQLEEFHAGMWKTTVGASRKKHIANAAKLMKSPPEFISAMQQAITVWPKSCALNFTAPGTNKIAWLGHAGCCIGVGSPEDSTRAAWHTLTTEEQNAANKAARVVLLTWGIEEKTEAQMRLRFGVSC